MRNLLLAVAVAALVLMLPQEGGAAVEGPPEFHVTCLVNGEPRVFVVEHPRDFAGTRRLCTGVLHGEVLSVEVVRR